jgi:hypothetical protein
VHVFIEDTTIDSTAAVATGVSTNVRGAYTNAADILSVGYTFSF